MFKSEVFSSRWRFLSISRASSKSFVTFLPVSAEAIKTGAKGIKLKSNSRSSRFFSTFSGGTRSVLLRTTIIPLPFLTISPARVWSSLEWGSVASIRRAQTSASSIAAKVRRAENFSIPTSRFPGFRRPAVSRISRVSPLNFTSTRLMSRVVPWRLETRACCFFPRELKRLDLPTFGRPIKAKVIWRFSIAFSSLVLDSQSSKSQRLVLRLADDVTSDSTR